MAERLAIVAVTNVSANFGRAGDPKQVDAS